MPSAGCCARRNPVFRAADGLAMVQAVKALGSALAIALLGCGSASTEAASPCVGTSACAVGVCVAGRCRTADTPPAKAGSTRVVLVPRDLAVLTAEGGEGGGALPETVALGRQSTGRAVMLLRFVSTWREDADIESAYFLIDPIEGAPLPVTPPVVEIARILSPWSSATTTWGRQPRIGLPEAIGPLRVLPSVPLRLDVTPQVRAWAQRERADHGLAVLVDGSDPNGVLASTGLTKGLGPHLEVYLR
jgi:hypothetical protein